MQRLSELSDDERWQAVASRDPNADGAFIVAVKTTGVYCRPICSGRPLRKNVRFYATQSAAKDAGFRACKRCWRWATPWPGPNPRSRARHERTQRTR
jgi:methylphosphotriester-DNA--protein-cysteine methyltransferase